MTTPLVSISRAKQQLNVADADDPASDPEIYDYIVAATDIINRRCGYTAPTSFTETVWGRADASGRTSIVLARTPVLSVQSITPQNIGMPTVDTSFLLINSESGVLTLSNWWAFYGPLTVTYTAGRASIPSALQTACLLIVQWMWRTQRGGGASVVGQASDDAGQVEGGLPYQALQILNESPYFAPPGIA